MTTPAEIESILNGPALAPPSGVVPDFENPPNLNTISSGILALFLGLAFLAFSMRIYTKWVLLRSLDKEDYILSLGIAFFCGYTGVAYKVIFFGAGVHQWNIQVKNIEHVIYYLYVEEIVYASGVNFIRISILLQYLRLFQQPRKTTFIYIGCWTTIWLIMLFYLTCTALIIWGCTPRAKFWDPLILTGHCLNTGKVNIASGSFNLILDSVLLFLPQYEIWKLHMSFKSKAAVSGIFLIGLFACAISAFRLYSTVRLEKTGDVSYNIFFLGITSSAEASIGTICCCLPVFPRYFKQVLSPKLKYVASSTFRIRARSKSLPTSSPIRNRNSGVAKLSGAAKKVSHSFPTHGNYSTLEGTELQSLRTKKGASVLGTGDISERDLPDFAHGIRMTQEITIEESSAHEIDLEGQRRMAVTEEGW